MKSLHTILIILTLNLILVFHSGAQINHTVRIKQTGRLPPPSICMVTVDPGTEKNLVVWEKIYGIGITSYNVYREDRISDNFVFLGNVPFDQLSVFSDINSFPEMQQCRYKISQVDTCGNESGLSPDIKPFFLAGFTCTVGNCLTWKPSMENEVDCNFSSIIIYRGNDPHILFPVDTISSFNITYVDLKDSLQENEKTYYRIAAVKEIACDPGKVTDKNTGKLHEQALSNLVSIHRHLNTIDILKSPGKISISPNPFETETILEWENMFGGIYDLSLFDLNGALIKKVEGLKNSEYKLQKEDIPSGCYIAEIRGTKRYYGKVFVF